MTMNTTNTRWRRVRVVLLLTVLVSLVAYTGCDLWAARRVARALAPLEARYGSFKDVTLSGPTVPAPENRARLVSAAAALVNAGTDQERSAVRRFVSDPAAKAVPPDLRAYMESNAEALRLARQFVTRTRSGFGVDYRSSGDRPPLLDMRNLSNVIYIAALQAMEAQRQDEAVALIVAGMALSSAGRDEPDLITQLIRIAVADPPVAALQRLMQAGELSKGELEQLAHALAENRDPLPMTIGLIGEVKHIHSVFSNLEAGRNADVGASNVPWPIFGPMARPFRPLLRFAHARYLEQAAVLLDSQTGPRPRAPRRDTSMPPPWSFIGRMSQTFTAGLARTIETGDEFARQMAAAELAVALRRCKLDRVVYPDSLDAVVPAYLPTVPTDPLTGRPPVYTRDGDGFTLTLSPSESSPAKKLPASVWKVAR
jgi:hypothetical protein